MSMFVLRGVVSEHWHFYGPYIGGIKMPQGSQFHESILQGKCMSTRRHISPGYDITLQQNKAASRGNYHRLSL